MHQPDLEIVNVLIPEIGIPLSSVNSNRISSNSLVLSNCLIAFNLIVNISSEPGFETV